MLVRAADQAPTVQAAGAQVGQPTTIPASRASSCQSGAVRCIAVGSGCLYRGSDLSDSQRRDPSIEYGAETAITVVNQETGGFRRRSASFYHLLGQPARVRVRGDPRVQNLSSTVVDDEEDEEGAKPQSLNREEIAGPDLEAVLRQELPPARRRRSTVATAHGFSDRTCADSNAKARQFRLNSALSPQRVLLSHAADDFSGFVAGRFTACFARVSRPPSPMGLPTNAMLSDDSIRLDDDEMVTPIREPAADQNPESPVRVANPGSRLAPLQNDELLAQTQILSDQTRLGFGGSGEEAAKITDHLLIAFRILQSDQRFSIEPRSMSLPDDIFAPYSVRRSPSPTAAAFPQMKAGRLPHCLFRGLLSVHCTLRPMRSLNPLRTLLHRNASAASLPPRPFRLLPAGTTLAGWDSHPLRPRTFARHTSSPQTTRACLPAQDRFL